MTAEKKSCIYRSWEVVGEADLLRRRLVTQSLSSDFSCVFVVEARAFRTRKSLGETTNESYHWLQFTKRLHGNARVRAFTANLSGAAQLADDRTDESESHSE